MPLINVVGGYDNVSFPPGATNQSTASALDIGGALESSGGGTLGITTVPAANSYFAWSIIPEDSIATNTHTSGNGWLTRVVAATGGVCGHIDYVAVSGSATNVVLGLYSGASFASGPLAWTAPQGALGGPGVVSLTWNGAGSPATILLQAGQTYWVYSEITGTTPTLAGSNGASAASMNPNLTASATFANNSMTVAAGPATLTSSTVLTPQTSWASAQAKMFFGLRA